jgi:RNA polymerase primary sigma factor
MDKEKGYLPEEEINDVLPSDSLAPNHYDVIANMFGEMRMGVDNAMKQEETGQEDADPVKLYLREMGSIPLLDREGEVQIAKQIEHGQKKVVQVVHHCPLTIQEVVKLGHQLRRGQLRVKDVVKDLDEEGICMVQDI